MTDDLDPLRNPLDSDDQTLEELLADLGPEDQWTLNPDDPDDIQKLLDEAKTALPRDDEGRELPNEEAKDALTGESSKNNKNVLTRDLDMSVFALDEDDKEQNPNQKLEDDSREIQDIVARLMDEVELERKNQPESNNDEPHEKQENEEETDEPGFSELSLPSPPAKLPDLDAEPDKDTQDFASDIASRMAALRGASDDLGLLSAPTFKPASVKPGEVKKKFTDEEIETWCVICQDDATIKCLGCEGELYCAKCWREGHVGPDAGWEEKMHKWVKFRKPN